MSRSTKIEWADSTFNPWIGCTRVSSACDDCYAARSTPARALGVAWGSGEPRRRTSPQNWRAPVQWNATPFVECSGCGWRGRILDVPLRTYRHSTSDDQCPGCGGLGTMKPTRQRVFCASLADVFDNEVEPAWRAELFALIAATPHLDWLLLTKRIGNVAKMIEAPGMQKCGLPQNVWLGATVVNQAEADRDIPKLLATPAAVRFVSVEPMLGPIDLTGEYLTAKLGAYPFQSLAPEHRTRLIDLLDWVICGGESGPKARAMDPDWVRCLRDQCEAAGIPFLFKQWGEWAPSEEAGIDTLRLLQLPAEKKHLFLSSTMVRLGKALSGRGLDRVHHTGYPRVSAPAGQGVEIGK